MARLVNHSSVPQGSTIERRASFASFGELDAATRTALRKTADRLVGLAERATGTDIDAKIRSIRLHHNDIGFDPFGVDLETARYALACTSLLHRLYFRTEVHGVENIPSGRLLVIANHGGQLPLDGVMIATSLLVDADPPRFARSMVEKWTAELPFVATFFPRVGQVVGSPDNARLLLRNEECIVVFPEGAKGISKTFEKRYQMAEFGLGFMRLALETNTPIVPVAVVGAEEQYPSIADLKPLARLLGMPAFPVLPQLLFGFVAPLPTKYRLYFGQPLTFEGDPDDDDAVIAEKVWVVRAAIQSMLNRGLREREGVFF